MADGGGGDDGAVPMQQEGDDGIGAGAGQGGAQGADNLTMGSHCDLGPATKTWCDILGGPFPHPLDNETVLHWKYTDINAFSIASETSMTTKECIDVFLPYINDLTALGLIQMRGTVIVDPSINAAGAFPSMFVDNDDSAVQLDATTFKGKLEIHLRTIVKDIISRKFALRRWPDTIDLPPLMGQDDEGDWVDISPKLWRPGPPDPAGDPTPGDLRGVIIRKDNLEIVARYKPYTVNGEKEKYALKYIPVHGGADTEASFGPAARVVDVTRRRVPERARW